jgi:hopanoid C-2 methylase
MTRSDQLTSRCVLCVSPRYVPSFGTFEYAYELMNGVKAFMPPQGLLVIAAALPGSWQVRFIDENMTLATDADFAWAEVVFVSGMHVQRRQIDDICHRAHMAGRVTVLGGPSVSACPDYYPDFDYLHVGEFGDATEGCSPVSPQIAPGWPSRWC